MNLTRTDAARGLAVATVIAFLGVLLWYLPKPGYTHVRLAFFAVLASLAVTSGVGVVRDSSGPIVVGIGGLLLLGFWQAVLWLYVYPTVGLLVIASLLDDRGRNDRRSTA